jgi:hypothetical protein
MENEGQSQEALQLTSLMIDHQVHVKGEMVDYSRPINSLAFETRTTDDETINFTELQLLKAHTGGMKIKKDKSESVSSDEESADQSGRVQIQKDLIRLVRDIVAKFGKDDITNFDIVFDNQNGVTLLKQITVNFERINIPAESSEPETTEESVN